MYKEVLRTIVGIEIFPVLSLVIFLTVFMVMLVWVLRWIASGSRPMRACRSATTPSSRRGRSRPDTKRGAQL